MSLTPIPFVDAWPVIFTDLDGSLLDHNNYSYEPARETLKILDHMGVAVIPNTSKTLAELIDIRNEIKNNSPFSVENGAAVYIPEGYFSKQPANTVLCELNGDVFWQYSTALPREHWQQLVEQISGQFEGLFVTFNQLGTEGIMKATGLSKTQAVMANERQFSETIQWLGNEERRAKFIEALQDLGAQVLSGGRFMHLIDIQASKSAAMLWLLQCYYSYGRKNKYMSIAVGDSHNDISMLETADIAAIIRSQIHSPPNIVRKNAAIISNGYGPTGWQQVISQILDLN